MNSIIEQLLLPRWETTLGCGTRDESRAKRGVKYGQHGHGVGHYPLRADMSKFRWEVGVSTMCKRKIHMQQVRKTLLWQREENSAVTNRCRHKQLL